MNREQRRKWTLAIAMAFTGGVLVAAAGIAAFGGGTETPRPPAPAPAPAQPTQRTAEPGDDAPNGDQALPTTAPPASWQLVGKVAIPSSDEAGPHHVDGAVAADFQRSPIGALIAARQIDTRRMVAAGDGWRRVVDRQVLPGPGRDAYIRARAQVTDPSLEADELAQIAGFRFVTYTPNLAVIQFASQANNGALVGTTSTVRWADGDWRLELQPTGASSASATPLQDLSFYTAWSGV